MILLSVLSIIPVFGLIVFLRFLFGVIVGFIVVSVPKIIVETVPPNLLEYGFGSSTNLFIYFAVSMFLIIGLFNKTM